MCISDDSSEVIGTDHIEKARSASWRPWASNRGERQTVTPYIWLTYDALTDLGLRRALTHEGPLLRGGSKYPQFGKYRNLGTPRRKGGLVLWVPFPKGNLGGGPRCFTSHGFGVSRRRPCYWNSPSINGFHPLADGSHTSATRSTGLAY